MPLPPVTYEYYKGTYGGSLGRADFDSALPHALAAVRHAIAPNEPAASGPLAVMQEDAYERAVCAACDVDAAYGLSGGVGETYDQLRVGSFSVGSYHSGSAQTGRSSGYDADMDRAVRSELVGTGLLCKVAR